MIAQEARAEEVVPKRYQKTVDMCLQTSGLSVMLKPTLWNKRRAQEVVPEGWY